MIWWRIVSCASMVTSKSLHSSRAASFSLQIWSTKEFVMLIRKTSTRMIKSSKWQEPRWSTTWGPTKPTLSSLASFYSQGFGLLLSPSQRSQSHIVAFIRPKLIMHLHPLRLYYAIVNQYVSNLNFNACQVPITWRLSTIAPVFPAKQGSIDYLNVLAAPVPLCGANESLFIAFTMGQTRKLSTTSKAQVEAFNL